MPFNSYAFIFLFLPVTWAIYFLINRNHHYQAGKVWLLGASLFYYSYFSIKFLPLILLSIGVNFLLTRKIRLVDAAQKKSYFVLALLFNLGFLGYFKYANFFLDALSYMYPHGIGALKILLPIGISFYTIQQIVFVIDTYEGIAEEKSLLDYATFVAFFPTLLAGPIAHHDEIIQDLNSPERKKINTHHILIGLTIFTIGLFKKVIIADSLSSFSSEGFNDISKLHLFSAWGTSLAYTFQLYFDFSGYSDMAIGCGWLFNIRVPQNFNSPLIAKNITDFWARWHMTLSAFIRTYLFTPLVRMMPQSTFGYSMLAMFLSMTIIGLWHGADWTFIVYGMFHGLALVIHNFWKKRKKKLSPWLGWFITFNLVNVSFVIFRAKTLQEAWIILKAMLGLQGIVYPRLLFYNYLKNHGYRVGSYMSNDENIHVALILMCLFIIFKMKNTAYIQEHFEPRTRMTLILSALLVISLYGLNRVSEFIYFNF